MSKNRQPIENESPEWIEITEHNDWEGETWHHFFLFSEEHYHTLEEAINKHKDDSDFSIRRRSLSWEAAEELTNRDDGSYMQTYWFGELTRPEEIKQAESQRADKGLRGGAFLVPAGRCKCGASGMSDLLDKIKLGVSPLTGEIFLYRHGVNPDTALDKREAEADVMGALVEHMIFDAPRGAEKEVRFGAKRFLVRVEVLP